LPEVVLRDRPGGETAAAALEEDRRRANEEPDK
jgi:hypothetical protein